MQRARSEEQVAPEDGEQELCEDLDEEDPPLLVGFAGHREETGDGGGVLQADLEEVATAGEVGGDRTGGSTAGIGLEEGSSPNLYQGQEPAVHLSEAEASAVLSMPQELQEAETAFLLGKSPGTRDMWLNLPPSLRNRAAASRRFTGLVRARAADMQGEDLEMAAQPVEEDRGQASQEEPPQDST